MKNTNWFKRKAKSSRIFRVITIKITSLIFVIGTNSTLSFAQPSSASFPTDPTSLSCDDKCSQYQQVVNGIESGSSCCGPKGGTQGNCLGVTYDGGLGKTWDDCKRDQMQQYGDFPAHCAAMKLDNDTIIADATTGSVWGGVAIVCGIACSTTIISFGTSQALCTGADLTASAGDIASSVVMNGIVANQTTTLADYTQNWLKAGNVVTGVAGLSTGAVGIGARIAGNNSRQGAQDALTVAQENLQKAQENFAKTSEGELPTYSEIDPHQEVKNAEQALKEAESNAGKATTLEQGAACLTMALATVGATFRYIGMANAIAAKNDECNTINGLKWPNPTASPSATPSASPSGNPNGNNTGTGASGGGSGDSFLPNPSSSPSSMVPPVPAANVALPGNSELPPGGISDSGMNNPGSTIGSAGVGSGSMDRSGLPQGFSAASAGPLGGLLSNLPNPGGFPAALEQLGTSFPDLARKFQEMGPSSAIGSSIPNLPAETQGLLDKLQQMATDGQLQIPDNKGSIMHSAGGSGANNRAPSSSSGELDPSSLFGKKPDALQVTSGLSFGARQVLARKQDDIFHVGSKDSLFKIVSNRISKVASRVESLEWATPINRAMHGLPQLKPQSLISLSSLSTQNTVLQSPRSLRGSKHHKPHRRLLHHVKD